MARPSISHRDSSFPSSKNGPPFIHYDDEERDPFIRSPIPKYLLHGIATLIVLLAISFYTTLVIRDGVPCTAALADFIANSPNLAFFFISTVSSTCGAIVVSGAFQAVSSVARKRLLEFRPILEIEVWTALAERSTMLTWCWRRKYWGYWGWTLVTLASASLAGLIPPGLVSLLSPIRMSVSEDLKGLAEFDFSATPTGCTLWFDGQMGALKNRSCSSPFPQLDLPYQDCQVQSQLLGALEAAKGSMLAHITKSTPLPQNRTYASSFPLLGDVQILGSTGGTLPPILPDIPKYHLSIELPSINYFFPRSSSYLANPFSIDNQVARGANFSLVLQGIWADTSCSYDGQPGSNTAWLHGSENFQISLTGVEGSTNESIWTYYLRSCLNNCGQSISDSSTAYAGIGSMTCVLKPRVQNLRATYLSTLSAYNITPIDGDKPIVGVQPAELIRAASSLMRQVFALSRNDYHGDLIGTMINTFAVSRYQLPKDTTHDKYPGLVASMIKGVFEYQVSLIRSTMEASTSPAPQECRRAISAVVQYGATGWKAQTYAVLPLLPLSFAAFVLIFSAIWVGRTERGTMTKFNPLKTTSLIAAAAAGGLELSSDATGDPEDEDVRKVRVKFGQLPDGKWGLIQGPPNSEPHV